ncbi:sugar phosphate isomerase/epimerase [Escherichia coli]|nr:sugar phosphate isomerase/epimerase [Escherichia coli]
MKLGFNQATCWHNSSLEQDIHLAEEFGYAAIEIRLDMLQDYLRRHALSALADFFSESRLQAYGYNSLEDILFCDSTGWRQKRELLKLAGTTSAVIGGDCVVAVPTIAANQRWSNQDVIRESVRCLRELSDTAGELGLRLAFEPIGSAGCCVRSLEMAADIVDRVNRSNVGLVVDAFNLFLYDQWRNPAILRTIPVDKIFIYHIDDADDLPVGKLDHCHRLFPGNGVIPLADISRELSTIGYEGLCSLELFNPGYWQLNARDVFAIGAQKVSPFL